MILAGVFGAWVLMGPATPATPEAEPSESIGPEASPDAGEVTEPSAEPESDGLTEPSPTAGDPGEASAVGPDSTESTESTEPAESTESTESAPTEPPPRRVEPPPQTYDPTAQDFEGAPLDDAEETIDQDRGFVIQMGVGITHCPQEFCTPNVMGGLGRLELGYRRGRLEVLGTVTGGGGPGEGGEEAETIRFLDAAAGVLFYPVRKGTVDPFLGASLGYARSTRVLGDSGLVRQYTTRGAVRFSGGILWKVLPRAALGPRVDVRLPFAGQWCSQFEDEMSDQCLSIRDEILGDREGQDKRGARRAFPRPWSLTLDLRITI